MTTGIFNSGNFTTDLAKKIIRWNDHTTYA